MMISVMLWNGLRQEDTPEDGWGTNGVLTADSPRQIPGSHTKPSLEPSGVTGTLNVTGLVTHADFLTPAPR